MRLVCGSAQGQQRTKVTAILKTVVPNTAAEKVWNIYTFMQNECALKILMLSITSPVR